MIARYATPEMTLLWSEVKRYRTWLEVELAATEAWEELGGVPRGTTEGMRERLLSEPLDETFVARVAELETITRHDVMAFTRALAERLGENARYLHHGLTSTDVVDSAQNLLLREALTLILEDVKELREAVAEKAVRYKHTPCIGRTHGVHAEPMTFGLKFLNFYAALGRDYERLEDAREAVSVLMLSGSVGTYAHVPPQVEAAAAVRLGLTVDPVTSQTVARDRHAELMSTLAILGTTLERLALEIRHLQRTEVREVQEGFATGQTGSSSLPHKKNPIASENLCGVARLLRSNLQAALENVALWHERDISHSSVERVILPDTTTLASYAVRRMRRVIEGLAVFPEAMLRNLRMLRGLVFSQRVLHLLIAAGLMREAAYRVVQRCSLECWESGRPLLEILRRDPDNPLNDGELSAAFDLQWYLRYVDDIYRRFDL